MSEITIIAALFAGMVSFLSPCILPLFPAFVSYLTGTTVKEATESRSARIKIFLNAVAFVMGFAIVFSLLGILLTNLLANIAFDLRILLSRIGGAIIIFFGLYLLGLFRVPFFESAHKLTPKIQVPYLNSFVFGIAFAAGWTPCVGAILGGILTLAIATPGAAFNLLLAYSLGLGIPFLLAGAFITRFGNFIARIGNKLKYFNMAMGIVLIVLGVLVFFQILPQLASFPIAEGILGTNQ